MSGYRGRPEAADAEQNGANDPLAVLSRSLQLAPIERRREGVLARELAPN
jgi:hypothetical protein